MLAPADPWPGNLCESIWFLTVGANTLSRHLTLSEHKRVCACVCVEFGARTRASMAITHAVNTFNSVVAFFSITL